MNKIQNRCFFLISLVLCNLIQKLISISSTSVFNVMYEMKRFFCFVYKGINMGGAWAL